MDRIGKCLQGQPKNLKQNSLFFIAYFYSWRWADVSRTLVTNLFFIRTFRVIAFESYHHVGISIKFLVVYNLYSLAFFLNLHFMLSTFTDIKDFYYFVVQTEMDRPLSVSIIILSGRVVVNIGHQLTTVTSRLAFHFCNHSIAVTKWYDPRYMFRTFVF